MTAARPVVVTGMGAICALGDAPSAIFEALCEGRQPFGPPTVFPADVVPGVHVAEVPGFAPERYVKAGNIRPLDRTGRLALVGVDLALGDSGWTPELRASRPLGLIIGTMFCSVKTISEFDRRAQSAGPEYASPMDFSNTVLNAAAGQVAIWQKLRGVNSTIANGAASGLQAMGYALQLIRRGRADALVAGGAEEICYESFYGFSQAGRLAGAGAGILPMDARRSGTAMGEGAAFLVFESEESAAARGATVIARVLGFGTGFVPKGSDPGSRGPSANGGQTPYAAAIADSGSDPADIGLIVTSASGSPDLDRREADAIAAALGGHRPPATAIKSMTGEALGASGPLQVLTAILAMQSGRLPGIAGLSQPDPAIALDLSATTRPVSATRALVTSISAEGNCCALVLSSR